MAISFIGSTVTSSSPNAGMTVDLTAIANKNTNDLIIIAAAVADTVNNALAAPTEGGYTNVIGSTIYSNDVNDVNLDVFYKYWNGTDTTATFAAVGGTNASNVAVCMVFRGVALVADGGPFSTAAVQASGIDTSNADPAQIATAANDAVVIVGATGHTGGATATYTNPTNYTTNAAMRAHNDTIDGLVGMGYRLSGYANPENPGAFTAATVGTATDNAWAAVTMALKMAPLSATKGRISWAEFEAPFVATKGRLSFAEFEVPFLATSGRVSWAELEAPLAPTKGRVSWAELEVPLAPTKGLISWSELEVPSVGSPTAGLLSWAEMEVPNPLTPTQGLVSWAEFEVPAVATRGRISWAELQVPAVGGDGVGGVYQVVMRRRRR